MADSQSQPPSLVEDEAEVEDTTTEHAESTASASAADAEAKPAADDEDSTAATSASGSDGGSDAKDAAEQDTEPAPAGVENFWPLHAKNVLQFPRAKELLTKYFMGSSGRHEYVLDFLEKLAALNGEAKPPVQFRVLTRGHAASTNEFLNITGLKDGGRLIHSVWDTHGNGKSATDEDLEFDDDEMGERGNKLDMINSFADDINATRVLFAEDMRATEKDHYEAWLEENEECGFECKLVPLPYEAQGLDEAQLTEALQWVQEQQNAKHATLVVFDFDCTITAFHFYKSLYWLNDRYHAAFLKWLPEEYFEDPVNRQRLQQQLS